MWQKKNIVLRFKEPDSQYARGGIRQSGDEKDRQLLRRRSNDDEDDGDDEDERMARNDEQRYANARAGLCAVCHLTVGGTTGPGSNTVGFEQALSCNQGHLLCQRCVQRFAIRSGSSKPRPFSSTTFLCHLSKIQRYW